MSNKGGGKFKPKRLNADDLTEYQCEGCLEKRGYEASWHLEENFPMGKHRRYTLKYCRDCSKPDPRMVAQGYEERPKSAASMGVSVADFLNKNRHRPVIDPFDRPDEQYEQDRRSRSGPNRKDDAGRC
jgi:hypothetical protein